MDMDEFQEADVLWAEQHRAEHCHGHHQQQQQHRRGGRLQPHGADAGRPGTSPPVAIPAVSSRSTAPDPWCCGHEGFVPPHEIAARRRRAEERAAFSVCVGHGRTLKGRDLRSVRTAVLRMTGFLES